MICLDSSVAAKIVLVEEQSDRAKALYHSALLRQEPIVAPPLLPIEVTNVVRQRMRRQTAILPIQAATLLDEFLALPITIENPKGLHQRALALASTLGLPATYDAHYLALSQFMGCEFWTADQRLVRQVRRHLPFVRWLGDYMLADA